MWFDAQGFRGPGLGLDLALLATLRHLPRCRTMVASGADTSLSMSLALIAAQRFRSKLWNARRYPCRYTRTGARDDQVGQDGKRRARWKCPVHTQTVQAQADTASCTSRLARIVAQLSPAWYTYGQNRQWWRQGRRVPANGSRANIARSVNEPRHAQSSTRRGGTP